MTTTAIDIQIGTPATLCYYTDREPATVIDFTKSKKYIFLQEDKSIRQDNNWFSEDQKYNYEPDPKCLIHKAALCKDGRYRIVGTSTTVSLGSKRKYHDYSF
jgi:hypothetical protein